MFSTAPPLHSQWAACNPTVLPPTFHNARYAGWPHPPMQLPHITSPLLTEQHDIDVANNFPSHYTQVNASHSTQSSSYPIHPQYEPPSPINLGVQASANMTGSVDRNSWPWNDARTPFVDMPTMTRHDIEDMQLIYDHSVPRTMSSNVNETQNGMSQTQLMIPVVPHTSYAAHPHPLLSMSSMPFTYDLRFPPISLVFPSSSPYAGCGYELLFVPLTPQRPRQIRLISPDFPWAFDVNPDPSAGAEGVTCLDVLATLHAALQRPLTDTEWATAERDRRASIIRARDHRPMIQPALQGSSNSAARTRLTVRSAFDASASNNRPAQRERLLLRVDWLGSRVAFAGLIKDEAFARSRLIPGSEEPPETWVVKFQRL
ncbi:uncharacterized protein EDB93DRAFT_371887 [Suillus bovinus]|uniref:uncharacterized protein n=1 Tax=Suillus bovinus TaxID=48563 RepID=UPI001B869530|nr:uncharacterized protein EDB93DRAFT_371887 [Suillus bovinus]KAG2148728.1 hypothetical protein EDB93DRAFT_371887 [Suillus bovinus]